MWWTFSWIVRKRWWFRVPKSLYIIESLLSWERLTEAVVILKCSICVTRSMVLYSSGSWECWILRDARSILSHQTKETRTIARNICQYHVWPFLYLASCSSPQRLGNMLPIASIPWVFSRYYIIQPLVLIKLPICQLGYFSVSAILIVLPSLLGFLPYSSDFPNLIN